ncbi:uncharacterized protein LOC128953660 isoform X1 [Oppia nitens]|uniref:uncharacterized protein LOC128953660 isoform X1 n=1 Tax=Oppia nitens TaxID=1686743 RepID=UPI0023DB842D|nr:uncharacterized protein LOC128953660 isoform X1 [Oppia nitens]XP_054155148.1 uncharacterized protein LOC128953660 isoform X1 [Oppia nitens]
MGDIEQEINLDEITDESVLQNLLDQTEDIDDRKAIRARIQELRSVEKARREEKLNKLTNSREERLQQKQKEANDQKMRTMAMYDSMAKSSPAGGNKVMDIGIYKNLDATPPGTPTGSLSGIKSSDLVEDALRSRQRAAEDRKKRMLAAFDAAARSGPAGSLREVNFDAFKKADVSEYDPEFKPDGGATFGSSGGVAKVSKVSLSQPGTPSTPGFPGGLHFPKVDAEPDAMERMIRARQEEAEARKKKTLAAYDIVAKQGAGPKLVCLEEFKDIDIKNHNIGTNYSSSAGFTGGIARS